MSKATIVTVLAILARLGHVAFVFSDQRFAQHQMPLDCLTTQETAVTGKYKN